MNMNFFILRCREIFFEKLFLSLNTLDRENPIESYTFDSPVSAVGFEELLNFLYTGHITINNRNVLQIYETAEYLEYFKLVEFLYDFMERNLNYRRLNH